jgi:hypothetical protein
MLALCWPEAMLQAESKRSVASLGKSGSVAPALQRVKAPSGSLSWGNFPDNIGTSRQWHPNRECFYEIHIFL